MKKSFEKIRFSTDLKDINDINPSFASGRMRIAYTGDNGNRSSIPKEVFEKAIPSMFNCPIVAKYDRASDSIGSHDVELVIKNNAIKLVNVTQPVGLVPAGASYSFEVDTDEDGNEHEYLSVDVILWKRQEAFEHIMQAESIDESMECVFEESHVDDRGYLVADKMYFEAFCLLESANPCYEGACVEVFSSDEKLEFKHQCELMLSEFSELVSQQKVEIDEVFEKGGKDMELTDAIRDELLSEFSITLEELNFEITAEMTVEEFKEKLNEFNKEQVEEPSVEPSQNDPDPDPEPDPEPQKFAFTYEQMREAISNALENTSTVSYYLCDFDNEYAFVEKVTYTENDYNVEHGRFGYTFDEETKTATISGEFELMVLTWLTVAENDAIETRRSMIDELIEFKESTLSKSYKDEICEIEKSFSDLKEVEEFASYISEAKLGIEDAEKRLDVTDIREHCFAIRGKLVKQFNEKLDDTKTPRVPLDFSKQTKTSSVYGELFGKYGKR